MLNGETSMMNSSFNSMINSSFNRRRDQNRRNTQSENNFQIRRVKFKNTNPNRGRGRGSVNVRIESLDRLYDDASTMPSFSGMGRMATAARSSNSGSNRGQRKQRGGGGRPPGYDFLSDRGRMIYFPKNCWFKIMVDQGGRIERDQLLKLLLSYIQPLPLIPYLFRKNNSNHASFYVGDFSTANSLREASGKITLANGQKITINVRECDPDVIFQQSDLDKIKSVLVKRYYPAMKALDLSRLYDDISLKSEEIFVPLSVFNVLSCVMELIFETIPDLYALDLSDNKIRQFPALPRGDNLQNLKILNLSNNMFLRLVTSFKHLNIEELMIKGNPLCLRKTDQDTFVEEVRKAFPKLIRLDGIDLPPIISFDTGTPTNLLPAQASFLCSPQGQDVVKQFIQQYFEIYDSDDRAPLLSAYHENAQFSACSFLPYPSKYELNLLFSHGNPEEYKLISRNLCQIKQLHIRKQKLLLGRDNVIKCLCSLPKTQHDPSSFTVDLTIFTPQLMMVSLNGVFRERPVASIPVIRSFSCTFVIVPVNTGFCIINELLSIGIPTIKQAKVAFKSTPIPGSSSPIFTPTISSPVVSPVGTPVGSPSGSVVGSPQEPDIAIKQQMVAALANVSGMNIMWAEKCLAETNWNYDLGFQAFNELKMRGVIPAEAFIK